MKTSILYALNLMALSLLISACHKQEWQSIERKYPIGNGFSYSCTESLTYPELLEPTGYVNDGFSESYCWSGKRCEELGYGEKSGVEEYFSYTGPNGGSSPGPNGYFAGAGGGSGGACYVGNWVNSICGGTQEAILILNANGTGSLSDWDCTNLCSRSFTFDYSVISSTQMQITYRSGVICGVSNTPNGGTQNYSCSGNTLQFGNTYTKR